MSRVALGLDSSTQSLTAVALELDDGLEPRVLVRRSLRFDDELPEWGTRDGQLPSDDPAVGQAPPLMWVDALDRLLLALGEDLDLGAVGAVAVSGQQHGSVYLNASAERILAELPTDAPPFRALGPALSREVSPLWTDSTTTQECREIREALGGPERAAELTGSDVYERFTGPQIRRFARTEPESWAATTHVTLVSAFITGVLAGRLAPLDWGDASGTNLMDLRRRCWAPQAVEAVQAGLETRLPRLGSPRDIVGPVAAWARKRHGLADDCRVLLGTGDNPSSALGVGLRDPGQAMLSLGTSDTLSGLGDRLPPLPGGHLFVSPTGHDLALLCFRNGSLAREAVRDRFGLDWSGFESAVDARPPGNEGHGLLPWIEPEIVPRTRERGLVLTDGFPRTEAPALCRAVLEGQALAFARHAAPLRPLTEIRVTGGASESDALLQIVADVFDCPVRRMASADGAAMGAALRALEPLCEGEAAWLAAAEAATRPEEELWEPTSPQAYADLAEKLRALETEALRERGV